MSETHGAESRRQSIINSFDVFRQELDAHHDRRDCLIKLNRDVTSLSKKVILLLHRITTQETGDERSAIAAAVQQSHKKLEEILALFEQMQVYLQGENFWRLHKSLSGGIQEYIEALSFTHYLEHKTLITFRQVQENLKSRDGTPFFSPSLPCSDYLLGASDLTGELMRLAITSIGRKGSTPQENFDRATDLCNFVRACKSGFEAMTPHVRELKLKQIVTTNSLKKIEEAAYSVAIRGIGRASIQKFAYIQRGGSDAEEVFAEKEEDDSIF